jgi:YfdX protein
MTTNKQAFIATLLATTLFTAGAAWAASPQTPDQQKATPQQTAADKDFAKVSSEGFRAFQDMTLTRLAIFDGRVDDAKKFVKEADTALGKAKTDEAVFTKAEADLKPPASTTEPASRPIAPATNSANGAVPAGDKQADQMKKPIAWLPVDGAITINEDFAANPVKKAAVADANKSLKSGDRKAAMEKLKLADLSIDVAVAVIPLEQTITSVRQATDLINSGKYYEASQVLRQAQDSQRFDAADISSTPSKPAISGSSTPPKR